jgi:nucleotide-binding universal stress UspA family protein
MFHRILVGVDDSTAAREALDRAIELVEAGHGRLGLLSSAPKPPPLTGAGPVVLPITQRDLGTSRRPPGWCPRTCR